MLFIFILSKVSASNQTLIIYTYDSFAAEWGPGPAIETAFEKKCECEVEFVATSNAGTLLTKIKLEGANSKADIVLGFELNFLVEAENTNLFVKHEIVPNIKLDWDNQYFTPYDYGLLINANGPETKPIFFGVMDIFVSKNNIFCCYSCFNPY